MTNNQELIEFIKKEISLNESEIFPIDFSNKRYWVKKARETKSSNAHKFFYFLFNIDILLPVEYKSSQESIKYEVSKIKKFDSLGINVPKVIFQDENHFALEDCGETVYHYIRQPEITKDEIYYYLNKMVEQLAIIHNNNDFHGGAQIRNFTYKNGKVYVIDFEESFHKDVDIKTLQFRDLILFILSLVKIKASFDLDYKLIINNYINLTQNHDFINRLQALIAKISFLIYLSKKDFIYNIMGTDLKSFFKLVDILKTLDIK